MKKLEKLLGRPGVALGLFLLAGALLLTGSIGGTRAALEYRSDEYTAQIELYDIGVTLLENDEDVAHRNYIRDSDGRWEDTNTGILLGTGWQAEAEITEENPIKPGVKYEERIAAKNSGTIDQYVRITIYKFWCDDVEKDADGRITSYNKRPDLDPNLIELEWANTDDWTIGSSNGERTVLYYNDLLRSGDTTSECTSSVKINGKVAQLANKTVTEDGGVTYTYLYDGATFMLKATVDAVQDHNATDAKISAWGTTDS